LERIPPQLEASSDARRGPESDAEGTGRRTYRRTITCPQSESARGGVGYLRDSPSISQTDWLKELEDEEEV